jgi:hypothetical protein
MNGFKVFAIAAVAGAMLVAAPLKASAQISVEVGVAPDCPYGYYDYAPYSCVPDGYYGPEWFNGGVFVGVGPWFDPHHGYNGPTPKIGEKASAQRRDPGMFKGNESRDGRGHTGGEKR